MQAATLRRPQVLEEAEAAQAAQAAQQVSAAIAEEFISSLSHEDSPKRAPESCGWLLWLLLVVSLLLNGCVLSWNASYGTPGAAHVFTPGESHHVVDQDRDGVPDHRDLCPQTPQCVGEVCPLGGWLSGRATDFDSDGCADGSEDRDKDNDGILDLYDKCPFTPQKYTFVSNAARDFDSDGCADGVEDTDDDNDSIPNFIDVCPLTTQGDLPDSGGCSQMQRAFLAEHGGLPPPPSISPQPLKEKERSELEAWMDLIIGCGLQVILGALLSELVEQFRQVSSKMSAHTESWEPAVKRYGVRLACYALVYFYLRQNRCSLISSTSSSIIAFGMRSVLGSCPAADFN